ncbi:transglycosylase SLT domain-containing protein [Streptomyces sp. NPDC059740]|uniref:transglycosylase SLT domain-containing protein n=1 Tax=Streptomyces sp. NPDC059740 TaxID=3346926 RepID=UPI0036593FA5
MPTSADFGRAQTAVADRYKRLNRTQKLSAAGVTVAGVAALVAVAVPGAGAAQTDTHQATARSAEHVRTVAAFSSLHDTAQAQQTTVVKQADASAAKAKAEADAAKAKADAAKKAAESRSSSQAASRSSDRPAVKPAKPAKKTYPNNLDGWIRESLDILHAKGIPASYEGIHRNIIRESSGKVMAINNWDINAQNGVPSKGLLQVIQPTFNRYHVPGTSWNIYDPVANITAACNYAADRYGSMDNVNSAY